MRNEQVEKSSNDLYDLINKYQFNYPNREEWKKIYSIAVHNIHLITGFIRYDLPKELESFESTVSTNNVKIEKLEKQIEELNKQKEELLNKNSNLEKNMENVLYSFSNTEQEYNSKISRLTGSALLGWIIAVTALIF